MLFKKYGHRKTRLDDIDWDLIRIQNLGSIISKTEVYGTSKLLITHNSYVLDSLFINKK